MRIHHDKHHAAYIEKLNSALENHLEFKDKPIEEILKNISKVPENIRQTVINNGGGHANHSLFWEIMSPVKSDPQGKLFEGINKFFGSVDNFKEKFTESALSRFGSGWAWLVVKDGELVVTSYENQNSPLVYGEYPIFGVDVWEHAYYLRYQNRRLEYLQSFWNVVNWKKIGSIFEQFA